MDYLIQNTGAAPIYISIVENKDGKPTPLPRIMLEPDKQITRIDEKIYHEMLKNPFYRNLFEQGVLVPLSGSGVERAANESIQVKELNYAKYVSLVTRIQSTGGLSNDQLRPFLDAEGMPSAALARKNLGSTLESEVVEEFRSRYLIERSSGLHESQLILPTGSSVRTGAQDVEIKNEEPEEEAADEVPKSEPGEAVENLSLEQLKAKADELGVEYDEQITFKRLLARVKRVLDKKV
jgi:hypothetical protein